MTEALFRVRLGDDSLRWATGTVEGGPDRLISSAVTLESLLASDPEEFWEGVRRSSEEPLESDVRLVAPVETQEVWAAGVTYAPSRDARKLEAPVHGQVYEAVFAATRPELFFKAFAPNVRGPGDAIAVRSDSSWNVPEPEVALLATADGGIASASIGNDVSSRSIEGANPLYLPQAKVYDGSCALGPCLVPMPERHLDIALTIRRGGGSIFEASTSTSSMVRPFAELIEWLYRARRFPAGAFLLTGTGIIPPPEFSLTERDTVAIEVEGIGRLENAVNVLDCGEQPTEERPLFVEKPDAN